MYTCEDILNGDAVVTFPAQFYSTIIKLVALTSSVVGLKMYGKRSRALVVVVRISAFLLKDHSSSIPEILRGFQSILEGQMQGIGWVFWWWIVMDTYNKPTTSRGSSLSIHCSKACLL